MSPELEAVLLCARTSVDAAARERMGHLVADGLDWVLVTDAALANQVLPLVASTLIETYRDELPPATVTYLVDYMRGVAARNMMLSAELLRVLEAFASAGVSAFPYKGPTLAMAAYGALRYREFGDLDILVPKDHFLHAKRVLEGLGFSARHQGRVGHRHYLGHKSAHPFVRNNVHIDLQWGSTVHKALSVDMDESLWESAEEVGLLGTQVRAIPANILFVFLCSHGARHHWDRLKWVCDVAELIRTHTDLNWTEILDRADQVGAKRVVNMALLLADSLVAAPIPTEVLDVAQRDHRAEALVGRAVRHHLIGADPALAGRNRHLRFALGTKERTRDRVRIVAGRLFNPTEDDYELVRLPDGAWFLYRAIRPLRLAGQMAKRGVGAIGTPKAALRRLWRNRD